MRDEGDVPDGVAARLEVGEVGEDFGDDAVGEEAEALAGVGVAVVDEQAAHVRVHAADERLHVLHVDRVRAVPVQDEHHVQVARLIALLQAERACAQRRVVQSVARGVLAPPRRLLPLCT